MRQFGLWTGEHTSIPAPQPRKRRKPAPPRKKRKLPPTPRTTPPERKRGSTPLGKKEKARPGAAEKRGSRHRPSKKEEVRLRKKEKAPPGASIPPTEPPNMRQFDLRADRTRVLPRSGMRHGAKRISPFRPGELSPFPRRELSLFLRRVPKRGANRGSPRANMRQFGFWTGEHASIPAPQPRNRRKPTPPRKKRKLAPDPSDNPSRTQKEEVRLRKKRKLPLARRFSHGGAEHASIRVLDGRTCVNSGSAASEEEEAGTASKKEKARPRPLGQPLPNAKRGSTPPEKEKAPPGAPEKEEGPATAPHPIS